MRCYNGCPDSKYQAYLDSIKEARDRLNLEIPGARCTYFPGEEKYQVFLKNEFLGEFSYSIFKAIGTAIKEYKQLRESN